MFEKGTVRTGKSKPVMNLRKFPVFSFEIKSFGTDTNK